jgi:hypothetical protein
MGATPHHRWISMCAFESEPENTFVVVSQMHTYFSYDLGNHHVFVLYRLGGAGKSQLLFKFITLMPRPVGVLHLFDQLKLFIVHTYQGFLSLHQHG